MENIKYHLAMCSYNQELYILAAEQLKNFSRMYPKNKEAEKCAYLSAYCYYLDSPRYFLDQTNTVLAIEQLQNFVNQYPNSKRVKDANKLISKLRLKLEKKAFENAKIYYTIKSHKAAVTAFRNVLNEYPGSKYIEDILYYKLKASYDFAIMSIEEKQKERLTEAATAYREFNKYGKNMQYIEEAKEMNTEIQKLLTQLK